jgi:hypothetical protein
VEAPKTSPKSAPNTTAFRLNSSGASEVGTNGSNGFWLSAMQRLLVSEAAILWTAAG